MLQTNGLYTSLTPEWYTPDHILDRVIACLGAIDLDPCSNSSDPTIANVPAAAYWTAADDGLSRPWAGRVYMNPPYGTTIGRWVARLIAASACGDVPQAIALVPARTDTSWFQPLLYRPICFVRGRLRFSGASNSAPFPSAIVYFGDDHAGFHAAFFDLGVVR